MITNDQLNNLCSGKISSTKLNIYVPLINKYMVEYNINNKLRISSFISNLLVESGRFNYTKEIASGIAYEGRKDLGNTIKGDGIKFKGRGLIQITGRNNYKQLTKDFGIDFIKFPELLEQPDNACRSACWFWFNHNLNSISDTGNFKKVVETINGGLNEYNERLWYYNQLLKIVV